MPRLAILGLASFESLMLTKLHVYKDSSKKSASEIGYKAPEP